MSGTGDEAAVLTRVEGGLGRIELNKPKAINALSADMVTIMADALTAWQDDPAVTAVLVSGRGDRGLCAGGDIKAIHRGIVEDTSDAVDFWADEYRMNHAISQYPKPYIAVMDGITMGGGVGISVHGSHRIVTETSKVGMPETGIGLFPDVGGTYALARIPHPKSEASGLRKTIRAPNSLAHRTTWLRSDLSAERFGGIVPVSNQRTSQTIVTGTTIGGLRFFILFAEKSAASLEER